MTYTVKIVSKLVKANELTNLTTFKTYIRISY